MNNYIDHHEQSDGPEADGPLLPASLAVHIAEGRLDRATAESLAAEISYQTQVIASRRDIDRRINVAYLNNSTDTSSALLDPNNASFQGGPAEIGAFVRTLALVAQQRFSLETLAILEKDSLAFDFGHKDQAGDWAAPSELDELIASATDRTTLEASFGEIPFSIVEHGRDHPMIQYEFWRPSQQHQDYESIVVIRKRPYADIVVASDDGLVRLEIFRKSWFLVQADEAKDARLARSIARAEHSVRPTKAANTYIAEYVSDVLNSATTPSKEDQANVLPCTMTYVIRIRNPHPRTVAPGVELRE